jgi:hypothetical protein
MFDNFSYWKWSEVHSCVTLNVQANRVVNAALIRQLFLKEEAFKISHVNILVRVLISVI